jgi:hypothetical protein
MGSRYETPGTTRFIAKKEIENYRNELAKEDLSKAIKAAEQSGITFETKLRIGTTSSEICSDAKKARCIIMGAPEEKGALLEKCWGVSVMVFFTWNKAGTELKFLRASPHTFFSISLLRILDHDKAQRPIQMGR